MNSAGGGGGGGGTPYLLRLVFGKSVYIKQF